MLSRILNRQLCLQIILNTNNFYLISVGVRVFEMKGEIKLTPTLYTDPAENI